MAGSHQTILGGDHSPLRIEVRLRMRRIHRRRVALEAFRHDAQMENLRHPWAQCIPKISHALEVLL